VPAIWSATWNGVLIPKIGILFSLSRIAERTDLTDIDHEKGSSNTTEYSGKSI
jgi:hypothetical protein